MKDMYALQDGPRYIGGVRIFPQALPTSDTPASIKDYKKETYWGKVYYTDDGIYMALGEFSGVLAYGETVDEAREDLREEVRVAIRNTIDSQSPCIKPSSDPTIAFQYLEMVEQAAIIKWEREECMQFRVDTEINLQDLEKDLEDSPLHHSV